MYLLDGLSEAVEVVLNESLSLEHFLPQQAHHRQEPGDKFTTHYHYSNLPQYSNTIYHTQQHSLHVRGCGYGE